MAHEIETHDGVVLHGKKAWHGLGTVVANAPTPREALQIAGLDWNVEQWPLSATNGEGVKLAISNQVMNVRVQDDLKVPLGVVTTGYSPIQNSELASFCELLAEQGDVVKVESAGSIRNGGKVWFLLKGESLSVRKSDEVSPYILVSNGHDGGTALRCTPTSVRVVCSNTLHLVIPQREGRGASKARPASYVANHLGKIQDKIEDAKQALGLYNRAIKSTREIIDALAAKHVNSDTVKQFFLECYVRDFGPIVVNPKTAAETKARDKSQDAFLKFSARFESEKKIAGDTAWNCFNAYTGWSQNDRKFWKNADKEAERRVSSKLFGQDAERATDSLNVAISL